MDFPIVLFIHITLCQVFAFGVSLGTGNEERLRITRNEVTRPRTLFELHKNKSHLLKDFVKHLHGNSWKSPSSFHTRLHETKTLESNPNKRDCTCPRAAYSFAVDSVCGNGGRCYCLPGRYVMTQDGCLVRPYAECRCPLARHVDGLKTEDPFCDIHGGCHCPHTSTGWFRLTNNGCEYTADYYGYSERYLHTGYNFRNVDHYHFCHPNPCHNDGKCVERYSGYDCICPAQYTGPHCEVDKCEKCDGHAICVHGHCRCLDGYEGTGYICEKEEPCEGACPMHYQCVADRCVCPPGLSCE